MTRERWMAAVFLNGTYQEAMRLLVEARDYLAYREPIDRQDLSPEERLVLNCEAMRLTSRLTQVMAWLLVQKAVHAGEITAAEAASSDHRLAGQSVCRSRDMREKRAVPPTLGRLLDQSYELYSRVERLDAMVAERAH
jgi:regulator of CtrA degradation